MIKYPLPPKKYSKSTTEVLHKCCKIFKVCLTILGHQRVIINNSCLCREPNSGCFCKYSTSLVLNNNLRKLKKKEKHKYNAIIYTPVNVVLHMLPYASFVTSNMFLLLMFTVTHRETSNFDMCFQKFS